jgi:hypothetical protein
MFGIGIGCAGGVGIGLLVDYIMWQMQSQSLDSFDGFLVLSRLMRAKAFWYLLIPCAIGVISFVSVSRSNNKNGR